MKLHNLYLIVGLSGSGKDTIADILCKHYNTTKVKSYTTRSPRNRDDMKNHLFVNEQSYIDAMNSGTVVAHTYYNGHDYWATEYQINNADFYVIDIKGAEDVFNYYCNKRNVILFYIDVSVYNRLMRMIDRVQDKSDKTVEMIIDRAHHDLHVLIPTYSTDVDKVTVIDNNGDLNNTVKNIIQKIECYERMHA